MKLFKNSWILAVLLALVCGTGNIAAQSDSGSRQVKPGKFVPPPTPVPLPSPIFPDKLAGFLKTVNADYEVTQKKRPDGAIFCVLTFSTDEWDFEIEVEPVPGGLGFYLVCPVGPAVAAGKKIDSDRLLKLMAANHELAPVFFSYRKSDQRICLNYRIPGGINISAEEFRTAMSNFTRVIQETFDLWGERNPKQK
jgi:hypothetical protein